MPDLRRQVLESGKTVSRKAASREASRTTSRASSKTSAQSSRNASRQPSDEDDGGYTSDDTAMRYVFFLLLPPVIPLFSLLFLCADPSCLRSPTVARDDVTATMRLFPRSCDRRS